MNFHDTLFAIGTSPFNTFLLFVFFTLIFHSWFIWFGRLTEITWKKVDYIWLLSAVIGLLIVSEDLKQSTSQVLLKQQEEPYTKYTYESLIGHLNGSVLRAPPVCTTFYKNEFSPPEFDDMEKESKALCELVKTMVNNMPPSVSPPFPTLEELGIKRLEFNARFDTKYVEEANMLMTEYAQQQQKYKELELVANSTTRALKFFGSFFLAIALAIRVTKVTAEIQIAKSKASRT